MSSIDPTHPQDDDVVSGFPANERASRTAFNTIVGYEHKNSSGRHMIPVVANDAARNAITDWEKGSLVYNGTKLQIQTAVNPGPFVWADTIVATVPIPAGTKMIFKQANAPTGWTQDTSLNDRVLRVVSGEGAGTGGSWTISGLTASAHTHTYSDTTSGPNTGVSVSAPGSGFVATNTHSHTFSGITGLANNNGVASTGAWRPAYVDVIIATKN